MHYALSIMKIFRNILLGIALVASATANAQVKIYGNVYGGGEKAQVIEPNIDSVKAHVIQDADLKTLFTKQHIYTTYVCLGENTEVYGRTFGGGKGHADSQGESAGRVTGQTDVVLDGATVWSELFGGGENADVRGNTLLHFKKGKAGHNAFGGGLGWLDGTDDQPDNQRTPLASADIKLVPNNYTLITEDNATNLAALKALSLETASNWVEKTGESFVVFDGDNETYTHYEFKKERKLVRDAQGNVVAGGDGKFYTENDQYDPSNPSQLFSINHNIYGGGMTASKIEGKTFVHINYGMVNEEMMNYEVGGEKVWSKVYNSIANAQFCVFGGGYGYHSQVNGDTYVTMDIMGSGQYKYINEFTQWFATEGKTKYHWDTNVGDPEAIYKAADESTWSHGAPGRSCMDVIGGGYNGKVLGSTNITVGGDVIVRKVYGGGYYASVGNTNVNVKSGIFNRVYGGGLIGNVYGKANLTVGLQGTTDDIIKHNTHLMVKDAIYGGNDVSGTVGTGDAVPHTNTANGVTYNTYSPVDDENHGVRLNMYGGLVLGDVYGAGNGNHPGYTNPAHMQFNLSQHPSENYRKVIKPNTAAITADSYALVYKYRPRTGRVVMNLQGNSGNNFNDEPLVDKVRIWGRTFGGGNSCNVGIWDGTADDNAEVYAGDGSSWHPGDNFSGEGHIIMNIGSHVQLGNRNDSHETPNGLFMGNNGEHMVTQTTDPKQLENYHHYFNPRTQTYLPGFLVFDAFGKDIGRKAGLKAYAAFINNILTWTDNVNLTINDDAQDVWMSNFVGGGYRGSMKAKTSSGKFAYTLPTGVTIGHSVVGGAFNAHIVYRVYESNNGDYVIENDKYKFLTTVPDGWVKDDGSNNGQYLDVLHEDPEHPDQITAILRYNFDGGIMGENSSSIAKADGSRCRQVRNGALDFTSDKKYDKTKALVQLNLRNKLEPVVIEAHDEEPAKVHGGIVYGGCFNTGYIDGDVWVDYRCSLSPLCTDARFFDKTKPEIHGHVDDLEVHNALNVFGAGYGTDTHTMGDTYLRILHNGSSDNPYDYPLMYNVFGGGNQGTVAGNTNVYYNVGRMGTVVGNLYGGGYRGKIDGNTYVELAGGMLLNAYGGSRQADIGGAAHVWAYDGANRPEGEDETSPEKAPLLVGNIYGGNDISGAITGGMPATWTQQTWTDLQGKTFNSYVQVGGTEGTQNGYPLIGNIFAGGNGANTEQEVAAPDLGTTLLEINGGTTVRAFGGGNKATVTENAYIFVNANSTKFAQFDFPDESYKTIINNIVFKDIYHGYKWEGNSLTLDERHVTQLYGGNNLTAMAIQPTWNLLQGQLGNVYSGGNLGDMTNPNGINITVSSPTIFIDNLFGGCRMANVVPTKDENDNENTFETYWANTANYGATVNCTGGYIGNVYGGNDISGTVAHGTKVVIDGAVDNDVYCAGNGNYLYKWDATVDKVTEVKEGDDVIYKVPAMEMFGGAEANDTQKLLTINAYRPSVDRSALDIEGAEESVQGQQDPAIKVAFVKGNVYCGGNASTVTGRAATKLTIGSHVNIHGLFMGSDGYDYSQQEYIAKFEKLNGFDMTEETNFEGLLDYSTVPATLMTAAEEQYYPTLVALYMKSVEMESLPTLSIGNDVTDAYIGTWCGGGNRGSMTTQTAVNVTIPSNITIYDKVVAGCMDAHLKYVGKKTIEDVGGYYRPLTEGTTKLNYTINAKFLPRYMSVPTGMDDAHRNPEGDNFFDARARYFLYNNVTGDGATAQYNIGNNIYGGCYEAGDILGDVILNVKSNLLEEPLKEEGGSQPNRAMLNNTSRNEVAAFNVYGAGMGMNSNVWGNVTINMNGNANNVYGGGRSGTLIGNATINMQNGIVYRHIIGGSDAGNMYGSTQIAVGKPTVYKATATKAYTLTRADEGLTNSIKLAEGDLISEAVYNMLSSTDQSGFASESSDHTLNSIYIGGGIYGGGYALATGSTVFAGSTTVYKYTAEKCPRNPNTGVLNTALEGYGGNATIMVKDNDAADNITISTVVPTVKTGMTSTMGYFTQGAAKANPTAVGDTEYAWNHQPDAEPVGGTEYYDLTGQGGIFGDGHLSFVEGFRSADIQGYGYATYTPQQPKLLNTMQRFDVARVKDCCIMLQGARDFATNSTDATNYSVSRIRELQLGSSIGTETLARGSASTGTADSQHTTPKMRNYLGLYKDVHFLGALKSDVAFGDEMYDQTGEKNSKTYLSYKSGIIDANYPCTGDDAATKFANFRTRNLGTAKNMIGINNGYALKIQKETNDNSTVTYGPVIGVTEVKLLTLVQGEGGGYVYAKNVHGTEGNFLNTSGNLVFQSTGTGQDIQYIVDDCFPNPFNETAQGDCHYWYVEGDKFWFNGTLTGYTANNGELKFNLDNHDQIISLSGTQKASQLKVTKVEWIHAHSCGYTCDLVDTEKNYTFSLSVSDKAEYNTDGGSLANLSRSNSTAETALTYASDETGNVIANPLLGIQLTDHVDNNANDYYESHLKEPCKAKITIHNPTDNKTYTMNLEVVYLKGPSVEGNVVIANCALPGEYIHAYVDGLKIETNDGMPVTGTKWQVVHGGTTEAVARMNTTEIDNSVIDLKALYKHNGYDLQYVVVANGVDFPVSVANDATMKTLTIHNYHKMADVQARQSNETLKLDPQAGARVYINNEADLVAFGHWINAGNTTAGIDFYLQNSLVLPADWNITGTFAGTLHGDGYVLDASAVTGTKTLFGAQLTGTVYNLGVAGGTLATTGIMTNCFDKTVDVADLKYGKKAYTLSHYFNDNDDDNYVQQYYANNDNLGGDWRYALTTAESSKYLRTGAPAYGSVSTAHNTAHGTAYTPVEHDYLFFGQTLTPGGDEHPVHIAANEANRVLEAEGYYNSKVDAGFYYNRAAAWAMQPGLTAVRFDNTKTEGEGCKPSVIGATADVTRNLLVYEADDATVDHFSQSFFHVRGSKPDGETQNVFRVDNLSLHDMQDFNAPYAFTATNASYERTPAHFVKTRGTAWESLCLPFAPATVRAINNSDEKVITHFYGTANTANIDGTGGQNDANNVGHEYWLREIKSVATVDGQVSATFSRPADANYVAYRPYIVSFPGKAFYEFDLTGSTIRWEKPNAVITVTDDATKSMTADGYTYTGAFANDDNDNRYVINNDGSAFAGGPVVAFRGYLSAPAVQAARYIGIGSDYDDAISVTPQEPGFEPDGDQQPAFSIAVSGRTVYVNSNIAMRQPCYSIAGTSLGIWVIPEGRSQFTVPAPGVYILNGIKFTVE